MNIKYNKEELEKLILVDKLSYREIGRIYGISDAYVKKISRKLGITLSIRRKFPINFIPINKGTGKTAICKNCGKTISPLTWNKQQFCDKTCAGEYKSRKVYENYLQNPNKYCRASYTPVNFKKFILKEQNNKCAICGLDNFWNNKILIFILDHINGDASNNKRENLRMVCPNCDSQLDTYKSKNKNSARKERYLLMKK